MNIVFIGAGRLATHLATEFHSYAYNILQVYSRTIESATELAQVVNAKAITNLADIDSNADLYIFSVKDSALAEVLSAMPFNKGLWVHTAGSIPLDVFSKYTDRYGVLYPFQTFSKGRDLDFRTIPLFLEANNDHDLAVLIQIATKISNTVNHLSSDKRRYLHLTGVFACNFVNHLYTVSHSILEKEGIPFDVMLPLIDETARKVHSLSPREAQTGPAIRYDENVINKHLELLEDPDLRVIYSSISKHIHHLHNSE